MEIYIIYSCARATGLRVTEKGANKGMRRSDLFADNTLFLFWSASDIISIGTFSYIPRCKKRTFVTFLETILKGTAKYANFLRRAIFISLRYALSPRLFKL